MQEAHNKKIEMAKIRNEEAMKKQREVKNIIQIIN